MSTKLETLCDLFIMQDSRSYAGAYGMAKTMAQLMFDKLSEEDQKFFEGVFDRLILDNTPKR